MQILSASTVAVDSDQCEFAALFKKKCSSSLSVMESKSYANRSGHSVQKHQNIRGFIFKETLFVLLLT